MVKKFAFLALCVAILSGASCPTEGDRQVVDQTLKAGTYIKTTSTEPPIQAAGADVEANALALKTNLTGDPKSPVPYSAQASTSARKESTDDHSTVWWRVALNYSLMGLGVLFTAARIAAQFYPGIGTLLAGPIGSLADRLLGTLNFLKAKADSATDDKIHVTDIQAEISKYLSDPVLGPLMTKWLQAHHLTAQALSSAPPGTGAPPAPSSTA